jgi:uncharacterized membrane protein YdjX (TVP38/TMEM64 family)
MALAIAALAASAAWLPYDEIARRVDPLAAVGLGALLLCVLVPRTAISLLCGVLFGAPAGAAWAVIAALLAAFVTFLAGRWAGRDLLVHRAGDRVLRVDGWLARRGLLAVVVVRMLPLAPFGFIGYAYGATSVQFRHYFLGTAIGATPSAISYATIGAAAGGPRIADVAYLCARAAERRGEHRRRAVLATAMIELWLSHSPDVRGLARHALGDVTIERDPTGKPYVTGGPHISLAHTRTASAVAVSTLGPVGVDLEPDRNLPTAALADHWFSLPRRSGSPCIQTTFSPLWTLKGGRGQGLRSRPSRRRPTPAHAAAPARFPRPPLPRGARHRRRGRPPRRSHRGDRLRGTVRFGHTDRDHLV